MCARRRKLAHVSCLHRLRWASRTCEDEGLEDVPSLLSRRSDDGAERGKVLSGVESSESSGDFHLHLHHAQGLFGEIVGEGNVEVDEEAQDVVFELMQPTQEVLPGLRLVLPVAA